MERKQILKISISFAIFILIAAIIASQTGNVTNVGQYITPQSTLTAFEQAILGVITSILEAIVSTSYISLAYSLGLTGILGVGTVPLIAGFVLELIVALIFTAFIYMSVGKIFPEAQQNYPKALTVFSVAMGLLLAYAVGFIGGIVILMFIFFGGGIIFWLSYFIYAKAKHTFASTAQETEKAWSDYIQTKLADSPYKAYAISYILNPFSDLRKTVDEHINKIANSISSVSSHLDSLIRLFEELKGDLERNNKKDEANYVNSNFIGPFLDIKNHIENLKKPIEDLSKKVLSKEVRDLNMGDIDSYLKSINDRLNSIIFLINSGRIPADILGEINNKKKAFQRIVNKIREERSNIAKEISNIRSAETSAIEIESWAQKLAADLYGIRNLRKIITAYRTRKELKPFMELAKEVRFIIELPDKVNLIIPTLDKIAKVIEDLIGPKGPSGTKQ